jgi:class 3 adenylate cyclase
MEPQISYVTSSDGTRIATWTLGSGRPLVIAANVWFSSIQSNWQVPSFRDNIERLATKRMVVQYDARGVGMSQREVDDLSINARVKDLEAVIDRIAAPQVDILGSGQAGAVAIPFAVAHPERVRRLVLAGVSPRGRDFHLTPQRRALAQLIEVDWDLYLQTIALVDFGWTELGRIMAEANRNTLSRDTFRASWQVTRRQDATELLGQIKCPTLVLRSTRADQGVPLEVTKEMAASIPDSRLAIVDTKTGFYLVSESPAYVEVLEDFLDDGEGAQPAAGLPSGTAVILFLDIADSTPLTERMGDARFRDAARLLDERVRVAIRDAGGTAIDGKVLGDGVMAVFTSAKDAIKAALECRQASGELPLHIGIHAGDVIREGNNVYGGAVNVASRVCGLSAPGEVLVSDTVRSLGLTSADVRFEDRGEHELKGVAEAVRVWSVHAD